MCEHIFNPTFHGKVIAQQHFQLAKTQLSRSCASCAAPCPAWKLDSSQKTLGSLDHGPQWRAHRFTDSIHSTEPQVARDFPKSCRSFSKSCSKVAQKEVKNCCFYQKSLESSIFFVFPIFYLVWCEKILIQAHVQNVDNPIHRINQLTSVKRVFFVKIYLLDSELSSG